MAGRPIDRDAFLAAREMKNINKDGTYTVQEVGHI